jgi:hypothetical protein
MHGTGYDQKDVGKQWKMFIFSGIGESFGRPVAQYIAKA